MPLKLTKRDWKVLFELEKDARQPLKAISRKVGLSKQLISYMLKKYEQQKIILTYTAIIDSSRLGYYTYRVYLRFHQLNRPEEKEAMYAFLASLPEATIVNGIDGYWHAGMAIAVRNIYDFYDVWGRIMEHREHIDDYKIAIYSPISHFTRTLISPDADKEMPKVMVLGGKDQVEHDEHDLNILKELAKNVRRPIVEIARKLRKNTQFVSRRIKLMEKNGVIQGYRPLLNWGLLGYSYYKIDLILRNHSMNKKLFEFCRQHPNIIQVDQTIGGSDFEFEVFAKSKEEFAALMQAVQSEFADVIDNYSHFIVTEVHKETFMTV